MIDPAFPSASQLVRMITELGNGCQDAEAGVRSHIYEAGLEFPVELSLGRDSEGRLEIGMSPPLYYADTSLRPSYHRVTLVAEVVEPPLQDPAAGGDDAV